MLQCSANLENNVILNIEFSPFHRHTACTLSLQKQISVEPEGFKTLSGIKKLQRSEPCRGRRSQTLCLRGKTQGLTLSQTLSVGGRALASLLKKLTLFLLEN